MRALFRRAKKAGGCLVGIAIFVIIAIIAIIAFSV